jgi:hypothetical protein
MFLRINRLGSSGLVHLTQFHYIQIDQGSITEMPKDMTSSIPEEHKGLYMISFRNTGCQRQDTS